MPNVQDDPSPSRRSGALTPAEAVWGRSNDDIPTVEEARQEMFGKDEEGAEATETAGPSEYDYRTTALHYAVQYNSGVTGAKVIEDAELFLAFLKPVELSEQPDLTETPPTQTTSDGTPV